MRIRSNSCPEPLERQKVNFIKGRKYIYSTKFDRPWMKELILEIFGFYEKLFNKYYESITPP